MVAARQAVRTRSFWSSSSSSACRIKSDSRIYTHSFLYSRVFTVETFRDKAAAISGIESPPTEFNPVLLHTLTALHHICAG